MNHSSQAAYQELISKDDNRMEFVRSCVLCGFKARRMRAGSRNALGATARLNGVIGKHLREKHSEELAEAKGGSP